MQNIDYFVQALISLFYLVNFSMYAILQVNQSKLPMVENSCNQSAYVVMKWVISIAAVLRMIGVYQITRLHIYLCMCHKIGITMTS